MNDLQSASDFIQTFAKWSISISSLISIIATLAFISIIVYQGKYKNFEVVMIMVLVFGDFLQSIAIITPIYQYWNKIPESDYDSSPTCQVSGALRQLGILIEFAWAFNIAFTAFHGKKLFNQGLSRGKKIFACFVGIAYPISFTFMQQIKDIRQYKLGQIGEADKGLNPSICFIQNNTTLFLTFVLPLMIIKSNNETNYIKNHLLSNDFNRNLNRAQLIKNEDVSWYVYRIFCYCLSSLAGLFDVLVYGIQAIFSDGKQQNYIGQIDWSHSTFRKTIDTQNEMEQNQLNYRMSSQIRQDQIHDGNQNLDLNTDQETRTQSLLIKKKQYSID
ncbi:hypothetical protein pb186bvf_008843 [Paramecium bursaria]